MRSVQAIIEQINAQPNSVMSLFSHYEPKAEELAAELAAALVAANASYSIGPRHAFFWGY